MAVKSTITAVRIPELECQCPLIDVVWIRVSCQDGSSLLVCAAYIPPSSSYVSAHLHSTSFSEFMHSLVTAVESLDDTSSGLILGDFNCPGIKWSPVQPSGALSPAPASDRLSSLLLEHCDLLQFSQYNGLCNASGNILDLVLCNSTCGGISVLSSQEVLVPPDVSHPPLQISISISTDTVPTVEHKKLNFWKADYAKISESIDSIDWDDMHSLSLDAAVSFFYDKLNSIVAKFVPSIKRTKSQPPWFSKRLAKALMAKNKARARFKRTGLVADYDVYSRLRAEAKLIQEQAYKDYIDGVQLSCVQNPRYFWSYSKSLKQNNTFPATLKLNSQASSDPSGICDLFRSHFTSAQSLLLPSIRPPDSPSTSGAVGSRRSHPRSDIIPCPSFRLSEICEMLSALDKNKNGGPDGLPNIFLVNTAASISRPLEIIFNKSLCSGVFPDCWKMAHITPIFKKGDKSRIENYRPVSILNSISKVFERLMYSRVAPSLNALLSTNQHGFYPGRSTVSNLIEIFRIHIQCTWPRLFSGCLIYVFIKGL